MTNMWGPSIWGRRFTWSRIWTLRFDDEIIELVVDGLAHTIPITLDPSMTIKEGLFWSTITLRPHKQSISVSGLPNKLAAKLRATVAFHVGRKAKRDRFREAYDRLLPWTRSARNVLVKSKKKRTWITFEQQDAINAQRPDIAIDHNSLTALFEDPDVQSGMHEKARSECRKVLGAWRLWQSHEAAVIWAALNEEHTKKELLACKDLFDRVEKQPLSEEQARAVICFDNRVQVVAAAGSGKTSTMVAKAAYAIHRQFTSPEKIVLLAFNKSAAAELRERAKQAFQRLGMDEIEVDAKTFHALGIDIIGEATGKKPRVPPWVVSDSEGVKKINEIIDDLKDRSSGFRSKWDLFRLVYGREMPALGTLSDPDAWDMSGKPVLRTLGGDLVRSQEEFIIANWLFFNGVEFQYERAY